MSDRITLRHLRYFTAVAEELSFTRAAERLAISQPPLSRQIKELEDIIGAALLERSTTSVSLTSAGKALLAAANKILADTSQLVEIVSSLAEQSKRQLRIGVAPIISPDQLALLKPLWASIARDQRVDVEARTSPELTERMLQGQLDIAFIGLPADLAALPQSLVFTEPLMAALPRSHPASRKREVSLADLKDLPLFWWARSFNPAYYDLCMATFRQAGFKPTLVTVAPGSWQTLERIAIGEGFTLQNKSRAKTKIRGLVYRPLHGCDTIAIRMVAVWQPGLDDKIVSQAIAACKKVLSRN